MKFKFIIIGMLSFVSVVSRVLAGNPPDQGKSTISGTAAPADGLTSSTVTIALRDASGSPVTGNDDILLASSDSTTSFNPSSATLDGTGTLYTQMKSSYAGNVPVQVTDTTTGTTITGSVYFYQPGGSPPSPGSCTDPAPGSTPTLTGAVPAGARAITLVWTDAANPVTSYVLSYGLSSGNYIYGNQNIGGQGTTTYAVGGLATGTKYYFSIRAVNGCTPGNASNELSAVAGARATPTPQQDVGRSVAETPVVSQPTDTPTPVPTSTPAPALTLPPAPSSSGGSSVATIVLAGTVIGVLIIAGVVIRLTFYR